MSRNQSAARRKVFADRAERERQHFNECAERVENDSLLMARGNIERYRTPSANTEFPLEYTFHLLGNLSGKTVVDLGCGEGLNTTILASLGASVISVDISDKALQVTEKRAATNGVLQRIRLVHADAAAVELHNIQADCVLCAAILHHVDIAATGKQIRGMLKPGGVAVFEEPMIGPRWVQNITSLLPKNPGATEDERPLSMSDVRRVSLEIGTQGRSRYFGLLTRIADRFNPTDFSTIRRIHKLDRALLKVLPFMSAFASPLVWEARKS